MLDDAGFDYVKIMASNSIKESTIQQLRDQGAMIDIYGVGENLITSSSDAVLGGVYKLVAAEEDKQIIPKIKVSENVEKITVPGFKKLYRLIDKVSGKALADLLTLHDEVIDESQPYELFDPVHTWKRTVIENYEARELLVPVIARGERVYEPKTLTEIQQYREREERRIWDGVKRIVNPHRYFVDLSQSLWDLQDQLLKHYSHRGR